MLQTSNVSFVYLFSIYFLAHSCLKFALKSHPSLPEPEFNLRVNIKIITNLLVGWQMICVNLNG